MQLDLGYPHAGQDELEHIQGHLHDPSRPDGPGDRQRRNITGVYLRSLP